MRRIIALSAFALCCFASAFAGVRMAQDIELYEGWNAVYLEVEPDGTPDEIFADWPVAWVGAYNPAAFLETKQYSGTDSTEGTARLGYLVWRRGNAAASSLKGVAANTIYVCFATSDWSGAIYGRPCAPRLTWHKSSSEETMNLIGFSVNGETTLSGYFSGLDVGNSTFRHYYGDDPSDPELGPAFTGEKFTNGEVLAMDSEKTSDWSGVLNVSPQFGLDYGTNVSMMVLSVRNDGATARTVRIALSTGTAAVATDIPPVPTGMKCRDLAVISSDPDWADFSPAAPFEKRLEPGATLDLQIAIDRTQLLGDAGTEYGALLTAIDVDGGSNMRAVVPLDVVSDGGASAVNAWPKGIWIAQAELDSVTFVGTTTIETPLSGEDKDDNQDEPEPELVDIPTFTDTKAGGTMKVRLPMYVDGHGDMTLLQRFWYGRDDDGTLRVFAGSVTNSPVPLTDVSRASTAFLPTDTPLIAATQGDVFGAMASFPFVVSENSGVNPMRHALHPRHDGLNVDFDGPAPSGDDLENYMSAIKPETFSITNNVTFTWDEGRGTAWNPDEILSGDIVWEFGGLRREGVISAKGKFTMKRISPATLER